MTSNTKQDSVESTNNGENTSQMSNTDDEDLIETSAMDNKILASEMVPSKGARVSGTVIKPTDRKRL
jgi:hypothetical protein